MKVVTGNRSGIMINVQQLILEKKKEEEQESLATLIRNMGEKENRTRAERIIHEYRVTLYSLTGRTTSK
jgi:hypothetical protein